MQLSEVLEGPGLTLPYCRCVGLHVLRDILKDQHHYHVEENVSNRVTWSCSPGCQGKIADAIHLKIRAME